jgi:hypothetical protein
VSRPALFISWSVRHGRSRDLAHALGAEAVFIGVPKRRRRWQAPFRWLAAAVVTTVTLVRRRPRALIVMAPPTLLSALALVWGKVTRTPVAIDAHTNAVLALQTGRPRRGLRFTSRFAAVTIVTNSQLATVLSASVDAVIVHDPITPSGSAVDAPFNVVAPLSWEADEPFGFIVDAARACPDVPFVATGRPPESVRAAELPSNLTLTGFLSTAEYADLISRAGVVLALTTREATMQRAGYEAMALGIPVIASGTAVLREFFGAAGLYVASGADLAAAVAQAQRERPNFVDAMRARRDEMEREFARALSEVKAALRL